MLLSLLDFGKLSFSNNIFLARFTLDYLMITDKNLHIIEIVQISNIS